MVKNSLEFSAKMALSFHSILVLTTCPWNGSRKCEPFLAVGAHAFVPHLAGMILQPALAARTAKMENRLFLGWTSTQEQKDS
jgi:hypothetical protein